MDKWYLSKKHNIYIENHRPIPFQALMQFKWINGKIINIKLKIRSQWWIDACIERITFYIENYGWYGQKRKSFRYSAYLHLEIKNKRKRVN